MRRLGSIALAGALTASAAFAYDPPPMTGHLTVLGPWTSSFRSLSVLLDRDAPDGFFFDVTGLAPGSIVEARVVRNGTCTPAGICAPYDIDLNFHAAAQTGLGRVWLGGCSTGTTNVAQACTVPCGAVTGEVTGKRGADLDVEVRVTFTPETPAPCR